jgi:lysophospholipase L1-like esterase
VRKLLLNLALVVFGLLLALLALEIGLRAWYALRGTEQERIRYLLTREEIDARSAQLIGLPYLNYTLNPAQDDVNERGYRGPLHAIPKPEGVYRIIALGGSTTYGHALSAVDAWPAQLERILHERGQPQVEVVNLGVPGYFSLDSLVNLATRGLALEPDLIILYDGVNDAAVRIFQDAACYQANSPLIGMGLDRGIWQSAGSALPPSTLYRVMAIRLGWMADPTIFNERLEHTGLCPPEPQGANPVEQIERNPPIYFERNLRGMIALARTHGANVLLSTFAWDEAAARAQLEADTSLLQAQAMLTAIDEQNGIVRALAAELDVPLVDLAAAIGSGSFFQGDQLHQTAAGAQRQAELYAEEVMSDP